MEEIVKDCKKKQRMAQFINDPILEKNKPRKLQKIYELLGRQDQMESSGALKDYLRGFSDSCEDSKGFTVEILELLLFMAESKKDVVSQLIIESTIDILEEPAKQNQKETSAQIIEDLQRQIKEASKLEKVAAELKVQTVQTEPRIKRDEKKKAPKDSENSLDCGDSSGGAKKTRTRKTGILRKQTSEEPELTEEEDSESSPSESLNMDENVEDDQDEEKSDLLENTSQGSSSDGNISDSELYNRFKDFEEIDLLLEEGHQQSSKAPEGTKKNWVFQANRQNGRGEDPALEKLPKGYVRGANLRLNKKEKKQMKKNLARMANKKYTDIFQEMQYVNNLINPVVAEDGLPLPDNWKVNENQKQTLNQKKPSKIASKILSEREERRRERKGRAKGKADPWERLKPKEKKKILREEKKKGKKEGKKRGGDKEREERGERKLGEREEGIGGGIVEGMGKEVDPLASESAYSPLDMDTLKSQSNGADKKRDNQRGSLEQEMKERLFGENDQKQGFSQPAGGSDSHSNSFSQINEEDLIAEDGPPQPTRSVGLRGLKNKKVFKSKKETTEETPEQKEIDQKKYIHYSDINPSFQFAYFDDPSSEPTFTENIQASLTGEEKNWFSLSDWMAYFNSQDLVGLDTEFVSSKGNLPVATYIQIASMDRGIIVNLQAEEIKYGTTVKKEGCPDFNFRKELKSLFENKAIRKIGFGFEHDIKALKGTFPVSVYNADEDDSQEISSEAQSIFGEIKFDNFFDLVNNMFTNKGPTLGLTHISQRAFGKGLDKSAQETIAHEKSLTEKSDIEYGILDALIPIAVYNLYKSSIDSPCYDDFYKLEGAINSQELEFLLDKPCGMLVNHFKRSSFGVRLIREESYAEIAKLTAGENKPLLVTSDKHIIADESFKNVFVYHDLKRFKEEFYDIADEELS